MKKLILKIIKCVVTQEEIIIMLKARKDKLKDVCEKYEFKK